MTLDIALAWGTESHTLITISLNTKRRLPINKHTKYSLVLLLLLLAAFAAPAQAQAPAAKPADAEFSALITRYYEAWNKVPLSPDNAASFYAKDAALVFYDVAPLKYKGWEEYKAGVQKVFADVAAAKFTLGPDFKVTRRGNVAWTTETAHFSWKLKDGTAAEDDTRHTAVWEKRGGKWLIVHEHFSVPQPSSAEMAGQPLYKRLGGYDAIAAVVDDFIGRLISDKQLSRFFAGVSSDSKKRIRQLVVDQLCAATGGPCVYLGRSMKAAHEGLGITEADWQTAAGHLVETLNKFHVPQKEKDEVLSAVTSLKGEIVSAAPPK